jgi:hypothetical protein
LAKELSDVAGKASEVYADATWLRALTNAIPYIGSSLDVIFASKGSKMVQKRIEALLENVKTEMSLIEEKMIDHKYLHSEEFFDIVVRVIEVF